jgi:hypothetical protein
MRSFHETLDHDGFVVLRDVVSTPPLRELTRRLADEYDVAKTEGRLFRGGGSVSGHLNCFPGESCRQIYEELREFGLDDMVRAVRPDIADRLRVTLNYNLPGSTAQHYHSDGLYTEEFLICNVAVVDTDLGNGALDVLPGTHQRFYKFWQYALGRRYRLTTRVVLKQGDVVVRKSTLWHRGMPNRTRTARPMLAFTYGELATAEPDPFMTNDGRITFYPNWYNTSRLGTLRERVFVAAPFTYSTYRFVASLHGNKGYSSW